MNSRSKWNIDTIGLEDIGAIKHAVTFRNITGHILAAELSDKPPRDGVVAEPKRIAAATHLFSGPQNSESAREIEARPFESLCKQLSTARLTVHSFP